MALRPARRALRPIAAVLIVIEVTRDYDLVLPLMLAVSLAVAVSRRISKLSLVEQQMIDEGYAETHHEEPFELFM